MFKTTEKLVAREMPSVICFLNARNMKPADIHCQLCEGVSMVRRWWRQFNEGRENVHDDSRSGLKQVV
jgi:hypothetical protein